MKKKKKNDPPLDVVYLHGSYAAVCVCFRFDSTHVFMQIIICAFCFPVHVHVYGSGSYPNEEPKIV